MPSDSFARDPSAAARVPSYRRHRPTGQAVVTLSGHDIYLGKWNTKASRAEYDRLIGEWLAAGRHLPTPQADLTIAELSLRYWRYASNYYRTDGQTSRSLERVRMGLRVLKESYSHTAVGDFGPLALQAIQGKLVASGLSRRYCNYLIDTIKRCFKWGVSQQIVAETIYRALTAVPGLRRGRTEAREPEPIRPVADNVVTETLKHLPDQIAAMVQFQRWTGCRPIEVCLLRPADLDRTEAVWKYTPQTHKTSYCGKVRTIHVGPKAQAVLLPWLLRDAQDYCFSPSERMGKWNARRRQERQTPMTPSQSRRRRKRRPNKTPGDHYDSRSYHRAIREAIRAANKVRAKQKLEPLPHWSPLQLRHSAATEIRKLFGGLEAVGAVLGHSHLNVSEIYAEKNMELAAQVMQKIG